MRRNLFTIAPGAPFLETFVEAFLAGRIVSSITRDTPPLALARVTIYVPTQRAARALAAAFARAFDGGATLLPRILPLGGLEERENAALFAPATDARDAALAPPIEELERRLLLSQLVLDWSQAIGRAIISVDASGAPTLHESEPLLIASSPASAFALAADLGALIDEFTIEGVDPSGLAQLSDDAFDKYWSITTTFLRIALDAWPKMLDDIGRIDATARQRLLIEAQIADLAAHTQGAPVIALGSTGANPTTARLLSVIAARPEGAVVLPGLDADMRDDAWALIGAADDASEPAFTHPQTMLKRLLAAMGADRREPRELGVLSAPLAARRALVAQALLPADATSLWRDYRAKHEEDFTAALADVALLEAPDERLEALSLALFMREALETPGRTAALVTPDRAIARRVAAELRRFDIDIDDSGGKPLAATSAGALARLVASIAAEGALAVNVAALLAQPLATFGLPRAQVAALAPLVEVGVLRALGPGPSGFAERVAAARLLAQDSHAHPCARRIGEEEWRAIEMLLRRVDEALGAFAALPKTASLRALALAHRDAFERITQTADSAADAATEGAQTVFELLDRLSRAAAPAAFDAASYSALFERVAHETILRGPRRAHPRLKILGPLEARLIDADLVLLAGLDEGVWPPQTDTGAFLNRSMRGQLGLSPPERRIGQSAHDLMMAMGADRVVLSRALKRDGSPTVASRFVTRLAALAGNAMAPCKACGEAMLHIAVALDQPAETKTISRPAPRPPLAFRPRQLSVTRIERLRRDPYAIFAEYVLELKPLAALDAEPGVREIGVGVHEAIAEFVLAHSGALPTQARDDLFARARAKLAVFFADPAFLSFRWPRIEAMLDYALTFEHKRRMLASEIFVERRGTLRLPLDDGSQFQLIAVADRIEIDSDGKAHVFDYKTGKTPSMKQVDAGWSPQLTLEAAMIEAGAFDVVGAHPAASAAYIDLGVRETKTLAEKSSLATLVATHREELLKLLNQFRDEATPYASRPYVALMAGKSDYDHLARVKEWTRGGGDE